MTPLILRYLSDADPELGRVIRRIGPCTLQPQLKRSPFESLVRAVANQQLHSKAADKILERFTALFPRNRFPSARALAQVPDDALRGAGFSMAKVMAIRDIAEKTLAGTIASGKKITELPDEEIIARLTAVRGVGRWTVEMLLIFQLGRPDVLPADDFGIRNGYRRTYGLAEMPKPKELLAHGARWQPYRTTAAWYLWQAADEPA